MVKPLNYPAPLLSRWLPILFCTWWNSWYHKVLTYTEFRAMSGVFRTIDPPPPLHPASVSFPRTKGRGGGYTLAGRWGGGRLIFRKTPDIGLASYSIIPLRFVLTQCAAFSCTITRLQLHSTATGHGTPTKGNQAGWSIIIIVLLWKIIYVSIGKLIGTYKKCGAEW